MLSGISQHFIGELGQNLLAFGTVSKKDAFTEDVIGFLPFYAPFKHKHIFAQQLLFLSNFNASSKKDLNLNLKGGKSCANGVRQEIWTKS